jgi:hypothetical protein
LIPFKFNQKHRQTLEKVFKTPAPKTLEWEKIEALFVALGCHIVPGRGSRVRFTKGNTVSTFHRPHPAKEAKSYQVSKSREFLEKPGVTP